MPTKEEQFELQPELTGVALAYRNKNLIADEIFPTVPVDQKSFQYNFYNKEAFLTVPETEIGEKGSANEAQLKSKLLTETCKDYALKERITVQKLQEAQAKGKNIAADTIMHLTDLMKLSREVRVAKALSNKTVYGSNCKELNSSEKFTNDNFNAFKALTSAMDKVLFRPNILVTSRAGFSALSQNPYVVSAVNSVDVKAGIASAEGIKRTLGLDKILIGEGIVNTAAKGQAASFNSCWNNDIILMHINPIASTDYGVTFGYRATLDDYTVGSYHDPDAGTKGCEVYRIFTTYLDLLTCPECGYLLKGVA